MNESLYTGPKKLAAWGDRVRNANSITYLKPISLCVHVTGKCNLNCKFCWLPKKENVDVDFTKLKTFIGKLNPWLQSVEITGGEPLLYPQINELIEFCHVQNVKVGMFTNGTKINKLTRNSLRRLAWLRVSRKRILTSTSIFQSLKLLLKCRNSL